jgi:hypothetical protein
LSLVFFRAKDLGHLRVLYGRLSVDSYVSVFYELTHIKPLPVAATTIDLGILATSIVTLEIAQWLVATRPLARIPSPVRWLAWSTLCVWVLLAAVQTHSPFIYFAF